MAARKRPGEKELFADIDSIDAPRPPEKWTLEDLLVSDWGFQLSTATPCQRAVCRILEGRPLGELEFDPDVIEMLGGTLPRFDGAPHMFVFMSAIRSAKSLISMAFAVFISQHLDVSTLRPGDGVRISILSTGIDTAKATFRHLSGAIEASPWMSSLKLRETADTIELRHPDGREVEIKVVALARAGSTLVGRFSAGVVIDEAPRLSSDPDHVETIDEALRAIHGRMLPGATVLLPGSPYEPVGAIYDLYKRYFGKPCVDCVVVKARGEQLNPSWWTKERQEQVKAIDLETFRTDCLAEFRRGKDALFDYRDIERATRKVRRRTPTTGAEYSAALSPGTQANRWSLAIEECTEETPVTRFSIAVAEEWTGTVDSPLKAHTMARNLADLLRKYGIDTVYCDESTPQTLIDQCAELGISLFPESLPGDELLQLAEDIRVLLESGRYELPPIEQIQTDMLMAKRHMTNTGSVALHLPEGPDGRRCTFLPLLCRARKYGAIDSSTNQVTPGNVPDEDWRNPRRDNAENSY